MGGRVGAGRAAAAARAAPLHGGPVRLGGLPLKAAPCDRAPWHSPIEGFTSFATVPLRASIHLGLATAALALLCGAQVVAETRSTATRWRATRA